MFHGMEIDFGAGENSFLECFCSISWLYLFFHCLKGTIPSEAPLSVTLVEQVHNDEAGNVQFNRNRKLKIRMLLTCFCI